MPLGEKYADNCESHLCGVETRYHNLMQPVLGHHITFGGFDYVVAPLADPTFRKTHSFDFGTFTEKRPFAKSDLCVDPSMWNTHVVGKISTWIDLDSNDERLRRESESALKEEIAWASYLSLQACLLPAPKGISCANYARCVNQILAGLKNMELWLRIPFGKQQKPDGDDVSKKKPDGDDVSKKKPAGGDVSKKKPAGGDVSKQKPAGGDVSKQKPAGGDGGSSSSSSLVGSWETWNLFRLLCEHDKKLMVALDNMGILPSVNSLKGWYGEPVAAFIIHTETFLLKPGNLTDLPMPLQKLIKDLLDRSIQIIISPQKIGGDLVDTISLEESQELYDPDRRPHSLQRYKDFVANLYQRLPPLSKRGKWEFRYRDVIRPLGQPLETNTDAVMYQHYEDDSKKYKLYKKAICQALLDRVPDEKATEITTVLVVVGAGRGALVKASVQAAKEIGRKLKVYAVEKNPNSLCALHGVILAENMDDIVTIVTADVRHWNAPETVDMLVSELLGCFGDNDLSPECLDEAQKFLKEDGISIPSSYTSFLQPLTASKIYNQIMAKKDTSCRETPCSVIKIHNVARLAPSQPAFTFTHPKNNDKESNRRHKKLLFVMPKDIEGAMVHGFAGYFDATLYKDVHIGTEPSTATPNVSSWYTMFFPLRIPVCMHGGSTLEAHFWRCCDPKKVWYEWCIASPSFSPIYNSNGRAYRVVL